MSQTCVMDHPPDVIGAVVDFYCPQDSLQAVGGSWDRHSSTASIGAVMNVALRGCDFDFPIENLVF